ncbi:unnamed protein product, partial [Notodromas monacha]
FRENPASIIDDEKHALDRLFPPLSTESRAERVKIETILTEHWAQSLSRGFSNGSVNEECVYVDEVSFARSKLNEELARQCPWLVTPNRRELLEQVLDIAEDGMSKAFAYHSACAEAYFKCLSMRQSEGGDSKSRPMEDAKATLRILSLTVRHANHMSPTLEDGWARTPTFPWKLIIPQLFSSLSNPNISVRKWLSDLVCRLAEDYPHLIVFPAVVGASCTLPNVNESRAKDLWDKLEAPEDSKDAAEESNPKDFEADEEDDIALGKERSKPFGEDNDTEILVNTCYVALLDALTKTNREHVAEVETLVRELRRITLLWDEAWLGSVLHNLPHLNRRLAQLEGEVKKVQSNQFLSFEEKKTIVRGKFDVLVKPILFVLEQLHEITGGEAETKHELWFQDKFGSVIENTLHCLRNPKHPEQPKNTLNEIVALEQWLRQKGVSEKSQINSLLKLADISPTLAGLKHTVIAVPGSVNNAMGKQDWITIAGFESSVQILPTKTRPKKLVVKGSDGKRYPFLFKGLEDLHLDERVMQFLKIVNSMLVAER